LPVNEFLKITQILTHKSTQFGESESSLAQPARAVAGNGHGVAAMNRIGRIRGHGARLFIINLWLTFLRNVLALYEVH